MSELISGCHCERGDYQMMPWPIMASATFMKGANIAGFMKVAEAMMGQGII